MKKPLIVVIVFICTAVWCIRYYTLNGTFAVHGKFPEEIYAMHETVEFNDCKSYNVIEQPGYSITLDSARIIDTDNYLKEINKKPEDFHYLSERYLELTLTVSNYGDYPDGLTFYSLPVVGTNWYTFFDNEVTACINPFFEDNFDDAFGCVVKKDSSATVKIAYNLYEDLFSYKQWESLNQEKMWLWVTLQPIDKRIAIDF